MCAISLARKPEGAMKVKARLLCLGESCPWQHIINRSQPLPDGAVGFE